MCRLVIRIAIGMVDAAVALQTLPLEMHNGGLHLLHTSRSARSPGSLLLPQHVLS
jgi:hypothetical protein